MSTRKPQTSTRSARSFLRVAPVLLIPLAMLGCQRSLFHPNDGRTQFDNYDMSRAQHPPQYIEDEFGRREPNLRGRLGNRD